LPSNTRYLIDPWRIICGGFLNGTGPKPQTELQGASLAENSESRLSLTRWLICAVACLGFAFDLYETLMLPLIVRPAIVSLGNLKPGTSLFNDWVGILFFVPSIAGGLFGLLGGYLTDLLGRRRILVCSILLYSLAACAASFSNSLTELLFWRCVTLVGVSVEFVAGITWIAELFPSPARRESVLAYTQGFHTLGGLMVTGAYYLAVTYSDRLPAIHFGHEAWRYTLLSGLIPAIPLLLVRPFLPESPMWRKNKTRSIRNRPQIRELFKPALRKTTMVATLLFACSYALPFGAIQHTVRMVPGLVEVQRLAPQQIEQAASGVQFFQELGGLTGRLLFALMIVRIFSQRRRLYALLGPALFVFAWLYFFAATRSLALVHVGIFMATMLFNALHSFWGNYLPRMYPTRLRGTGEAFAASVGGRVIGVSAALMTTSLSNVMPGVEYAIKLAYSAGVVSVLFLAAALVGALALNEPEGDHLPE
jgi:MFS family permease